ncbi:MAG: four helix bundle protein [Bacteroidia bacterium]
MRTKDDWINLAKQLALGVLKITDSLKPGPSNNEIIRQITRCSLSVGTNYRATKRAKSTRDFLNKLKIGEEETDETIYFLEIISERESKTKSEIQELIKQYVEILSVVVASINTLKKNNPDLN